MKETSNTSVAPFRDNGGGRLPICSRLRRSGSRGFVTALQVMREHWPAILIIVAIFVFSACTIRDGQVWDDDPAQYILHARNIAEGRPYSQTGYIFNPEYGTLGPRSYPPGFPLLLAPVWALRGLDLNAMKLLECGMFAAALALLYVLYRKH